MAAIFDDVLTADITEENYNSGVVVRVCDFDEYRHSFAFRSLTL